jgi:hypothetical protein
VVQLPPVEVLILLAVLGIHDILDPTPFFINFQDAKKNFLHIFFLQLAHRHTVFSPKSEIFAKICVKFLFAGIISVRSTHL